MGDFMSELYKRITVLCKDRGITVTELCRQCEISRASLSDLKTGRKQSISTKNLSKIANFFDVPTDFLLGMDKKEAPVLSPKDERDIAKRLDNILHDLNDTDSGLMFNGEPIDEETRNLLRISLQNQFKISKRIAKNRFTSKKHQA